MPHIALFTLCDTSGAATFATQLIQSGWEIIATRETVDVLQKNGLSVQDIADFTGVREDYGFPPTLHPKVEHALTGSGAPRIDLVYAIPYPRTTGNDVGGRTLLALAVKGGRIAVMNAADMQKVTVEIAQHGTVPEKLRQELADKACFAIATHYAAQLSERKNYDCIAGRLSQPLRNGENPYQIPASAFVDGEDNDPLSLLQCKLVSGEPPCFTNLADADCILQTIGLAAEAFRLNTSVVPYLCVAAKHGNACGLGVSEKSPAVAITSALFGNPRAIWGGEVVTNFPIDEKLADLLCQSQDRELQLGNRFWMLDVVLAPSFSAAAIARLGKRQTRKLLANEKLHAPMPNKAAYVYRHVRGGFLRQPPASYVLDLSGCRVIGRQLLERDIAALAIAWAVAYSSNHGGNEIAIAKSDALLSVGGGPSTVEAAEVAVARAKANGHELKDAAFAADAFFPFTDAPAVLAQAGVMVGCVPGGGKQQPQVQEYFRTRDVTVAYLPPEYRGFCRH